MRIYRNYFKMAVSSNRIFYQIFESNKYKRAYLSIHRFYYEVIKFYVHRKSPLV
nr:MAG TPA: hypothetical protein [Caudoviricetes sp.]